MRAHGHGPPFPAPVLRSGAISPYTAKATEKAFQREGELARQHVQQHYARLLTSGRDEAAEVDTTARRDLFLYGKRNARDGERPTGGGCGGHVDACALAS